MNSIGNFGEKTISVTRLDERERERAKERERDSLLQLSVEK